MQWDPATKQVLYKINLTETTQGKYAGFAIIAHDPDDSAYVVGRLPSSILKIDKYGKTVTLWYLPEPIIPTNAGTGSIAATGWTLLVSDANSKILKFDMRKQLGVPVEVPHYPNVNWTFTDSGYIPPRYKVPFASSRKTLSALSSCNRRTDCEMLRNSLGRSRIQYPIHIQRSRFRLEIASISYRLMLTISVILIRVLGRRTSSLSLISLRR
jgi:hypothetical protein